MVTPGLRPSAALARDRQNRPRRRHSGRDGCHSGSGVDREYLVGGAAPTDETLDDAGDEALILVASLTREEERGDGHGQGTPQ